MTMRIPDRRPPTHPGEMMKEEFMAPNELSDHEIARRTGIPISHVSGIVAGQRDITRETADRLARVLGTTPDFWMNGQRAVDAYRASKRTR
jgi:addiction module HigA family antidote